MSDATTVRNSVRNGRNPETETRVRPSGTVRNRPEQYNACVGPTPTHADDRQREAAPATTDDD